MIDVSGIVSLLTSDGMVAVAAICLAVFDVYLLYKIYRLIGDFLSIMHGTSITDQHDYSDHYSEIEWRNEVIEQSEREQYLNSGRAGEISQKEFYKERDQKNIDDTIKWLQENK